MKNFILTIFFLSALGFGNLVSADQEWHFLAGQGDVAAQFNLGVMYSLGDGVQQDYKESAKWYRKAADQGHAKAQHYLGVLYQRGDGVPQDFQEAVYWYHKAAEQGYATGQYNLGRMYASGKGIQQNSHEAIKWFRRAAEQGHASAQVMMGFEYFNGDDIPQDDREGIKWFHKAAEQGDAGAQAGLGSMYYDGERVTRDYYEAVKWNREAAEQGEPVGQYGLGLAYEQGRGIKQNYYKAVEWYRKAAQQGNDKGLNNLGAMYANGKGVVRDYVQAYRWFNLAATAGNVLASDNRDNIAPYMTSSQIAEAQSLSASFRPNKSTSSTTLSPAYIAADRDTVRESQSHLKKSTPKSVNEPSYAAVNRNTVREIQSRLTTLGYNPGPADGISGRRTVAAVKEYQRFVGIQSDGILSSALLKILKTPVAQKPKPEQSTNKEPQLVSYGSGFIVSKEYVVTNRHVINECRNLSVYLGGRPVAGSIVASSDVDDLAVIKLAESTSSQAKFRNSGRARLGERIRVVGYPLRDILASSMSVVSGEISALAGIGNNVRLIQMSAPVQPGNSGGPILDDSGNVIGMVVSKLDALKVAEITGDLPQNINFAIKGVIVKSFLDINGIDYQTAPSDVEKRGEEIAAEARKFTVAVECYNQL